MNRLIAIQPIEREDNEIRPPYKCMCCGDSGLVESSFLEQFVEGNNATKFICKRDCEAGTKYRNAYKLSDAERQEFAKKHGGEAIPARVYQAQFDYRLSAEMCEAIHNWEKAIWAKNLQANYAAASETRQSIQDLTTRKAIA